MTSSDPTIDLLLNHGLLSEEQARRLEETRSLAPDDTWDLALKSIGVDLGKLDLLSSGSDGLGSPDLTPEAEGRYAHISVLGAGGMGRVELVDDTHLNRRVARKELLLPLSTLAPRFLREARITAQMEHPGIVPVYELGRRPNGTLYYTMKQVRGRSLRETLETCETADQRLQLLEVFAAVCHAMAYAHSKNVVHRDLKPDNVMIGRFGEVMVVDWGLAKLAGDEDLPFVGTSESVVIRSGDDSLTRAGSVMGTPLYMSPEQARGQPTVDCRADVWSLGVMLYELLCGTTPFANSGADVLVEVREGRVARLVDPDLPAELVAVVHKATAHDPHDRYADAAEMAVEIDAFRTGRLVGAYAYSSADLLRRFVRRQWLPLTVGLAGLFTVLVISALSVAGISRERDAVKQAWLRADARALGAEAGKRELSNRRDDAMALFWAALTVAEEAGEDTDDLAAELERLAQQGPAAKVLWGHSTVMMGLDFSPNGESLLSWSRDGTARIWSLEDGLRTTLKMDGKPVIRDALWWPDGGRIAVAGDHSEVCIWAGDSWDRERCLVAASASVLDLALSVDGGLLAAAGGSDGVVTVWNTRDWTVVGEYKGRTEHVLEVLFLDHDRVVVASDSGSSLLAFEVESGDVLWEAGVVDPSSLREPLVVATPEGDAVIHGASCSELMWYDARTGAATELPAMDEGLCYDASWTDDGATLMLSATEALLAWNRLTDQVHAMPTSPGSLRTVPGRGVAALSGEHWGLYDVQTLAVRTAFPSAEKFGSVAVSPDGGTVAMSRDKYVLVWDVGRMPKLAITGGETRGLGLSASRHRLAMPESDGSPAVYSTETGRQLLAVDFPRGEATETRVITLSEDGEMMAAGSNMDGVIGVWSVTERRLLWALEGHRRLLDALAFSPDGRWLASGSKDNSVRLWDMEAGEQHAVLEGHTNWVWAVSFSADGTRLYSASADETARVWEVPSGRLVTVLRDGEQPVNGFRLSPDGQTLATTSTDATVRLWDPMDGTLVRTFEAENQTGQPVFSPDGSSLVTGDTKGALYHWSLDDGRLLYRVHEHRTLLAASAFSSDGTLLITGDKDGVALLWDAASGERLASFGGHAGRIEAVGFDPLGRAFIVDRNGRFSAWEPDRVDPLAQPIEALAGQSNIRVCKGTVDIRRVRPFPDASTPWAPADKCD